MKKMPVVLIAALILLGGLSACSAGSKESDTDASGATQSGPQVIAPVIVDVDELAGTTVELTRERPLVISSEDPTAWTGTVGDPTVARFDPGKATDTAAFNFGFTPLKEGQTTASITDGDTTVDFTIVVE